MNNKELINAGHALAKAISNDTPLIEIAKMVSNLATQLDVQLARSNALAAENAGLKSAAEFSTAPDMWVEQADGALDYRYCEWYVDVLKAAMETPATDAFLAEVRASAITDALESLDGVFDTDCVMESNGISYEDAEQRTAGAYAVSKALEEFAAQLRQEAAQ